MLFYSREAMLQMMDLGFNCFNGTLDPIRSATSMLELVITYNVSASQHVLGNCVFVWCARSLNTTAA